MRVRILVFGVLKDLIPETDAMVELPEGARVRDLLDRCRASVTGQFAGQDALWGSLATAVNREYVSADHALGDGDEVALLPPVSGGADARVALTREPIDAESLVAALKRGEDGAVVVFDGIVRNNSRGRRTLYLVYEAYEEMALSQMRALAAKAGEDFRIRDIVLVHRLGRLAVGESSVLVAVASAHRAAAFDACRWLIDTLKKTVPIWKKEHFEDGAVWADGEPWPDPGELQFRRRT
ncbi:MAG: molybdenum cofactor biosynthesis protein MoaE [Acidobacteriaceae bacterium]